MIPVKTTENGMSVEQSFSDLYGYFCGMIAKEILDGINGQMMGAIPDLGSVKGNIILETQIRMKIN